jgi:zinc-binding in reverse transcriptase
MKQQGRWNPPFRLPLTQEAQAQKLRLLATIPQPQDGSQEKDQATWRWANCGRFTVKSCYMRLVQGPYIKMPHLKSIWKLNLPPRMEIFAWLMMQNKILTTNNLVKRGWLIPNICHLCRQQEENVAHLFSIYDYATDVRQKLIQQYEQGTTIPAAFVHGRTKELMQEQGQIQMKRLCIIKCFVIWRERCARIFREIYKAPQQIVTEITEEMTNWT